MAPAFLAWLDAERWRLMRMGVGVWLDEASGLLCMGGEL